MSAVDVVAATLGVLVVCRAGRVRVSATARSPRWLSPLAPGSRARRSWAEAIFVELVVAIAAYGIVVLLTRALPGEVWEGIFRSGRALGA